jgi:hypothetical protein
MTTEENRERRRERNEKIFPICAHAQKLKGGREREKLVGERVAVSKEREGAGERGQGVVELVSEV